VVVLPDPSEGVGSTTTLCRWKNRNCWASLLKSFSMYRIEKCEIVAHSN